MERLSRCRTKQHSVQHTPAARLLAPSSGLPSSSSAAGQGAGPVPLARRHVPLHTPAPRSLTTALAALSSRPSASSSSSGRSTGFSCLVPSGLSSRLTPTSAASAARPAPRRLLQVSALDMLSSAPDALASSDGSMTDSILEVEFDNASDAECTVVTIEGKDQSHLLMTLSGAFSAMGIVVLSASIKSDLGRVLDVFHVQKPDRQKIPESDFELLRQRILQITAGGSSRSSKPAIYGIVAAAEVERLRPLTGAAARDDVSSLELTAAEMAQAAAELVTTEREILALRKHKGDASVLQAKEIQRAESAAGLERKMAAMQAVLAARRFIVAEPEKVVTPEEAAKAAVSDLMRPMTGARAVAGAGCGNGHEILLQAFNWESHRSKWYRTLAGQVPDFAKAGFTCVWMPPPSDSVSPQGYLPRDLYALDCGYGTEAELRDLISLFHEHSIKVIADIVVNHRCAHSQGPDGKWNKFGGRMAWDASAIACNNPAFGGRGNPKQGDDYEAAPNIDHSQEPIRNDIVNWMKWMRNSIGFDGWRFDFVRGYLGQYAKEYIDATVPEMAFGEFWDSCDYTDGVLNYNQDSHRQRTINWCDSTGGTAAAFDFTTKGVLQEALGRREYWRLADSQGRPPGVLGLWPSRAITFIDNHDTGSTLNHWPFPSNHLHEGYCYLLTHPGTPTVFYDHLMAEHNKLRTAILELMAVRRKHGIHCRSKVVIKKATNDIYAAVVDDKIAMKIGSGDWSPGSAGIKLNGKDLKLACSGPNFAVWEVSA